MTEIKAVMVLIPKRTNIKTRSSLLETEKNEVIHRGRPQIKKNSHQDHSTSKQHQDHSKDHQSQSHSKHQSNHSIENSNRSHSSHHHANRRRSSRNHLAKQNPSQAMDQKSSSINRKREYSETFNDRSKSRKSEGSNHKRDFDEEVEDGEVKEDIHKKRKNDSSKKEIKCLKTRVPARVIDFKGVY